MTPVQTKSEPGTLDGITGTLVTLEERIVSGIAPSMFTTVLTTQYFESYESAERPKQRFISETSVMTQDNAPVFYPF